MLPVSKINYGDVVIDMLRLDMAHPAGQGNKYYKLRYNLEEAKRLGHTTLLTFGGAFSNHIHATAIAGKQAGFRSVGVIRGEPDPQNPTLLTAKENGMQLHFVSREEYRNKNDEKFLFSLQERFGSFYLLPEGGTNQLAVLGCSEILSGIEDTYDLVVCAVGTGGTLAGLICAPARRAKCIGIAVLKGDDRLTKDVRSLATNANTNWEINFDYHFGGYAKYHAGLVDFIRRVYDEHQILLDPVYTGKMLYAVFDMIDKGRMTKDTRVLAIHTGGLQGIAGWEYRFGKRIV